MPRPNPPRAVAEEEHLAERIAYERERLGMSYEGLAKRMTDLGCPINQSALYKIEKGSPRRRITYAEAVTLARVFELSLEELSVPPALALNTEVTELLRKWEECRDSISTLGAELMRIQSEIVAVVKAHPDTEDAVRAALETYFRRIAPDRDPAQLVDYWAINLAGADHDRLTAHSAKYLPPDLAAKFGLVEKGVRGGKRRKKT